MDIKCDEDTVFFDLATVRLALQLSEIGNVSMEQALGEIRSCSLDMLSLGCLQNIRAELGMCTWAWERFLD